MDEWSERPVAGVVLQGRYVLEETVAKSGMSEVWRAGDQTTGRFVAVKFLRMDSEDTHHLDAQERREVQRELLGRFRREALLLEQLAHPGIPEFYAQGSFAGRPYLVMQWVEGVTLHDFLKRHGALALPVAVAGAVQIARALAHAHAHSVVHRDVKPYNVMLADDGTVVLIDFGIAKPLTDEATRYTRPGSTLGSFGYQAPEQIQALKASTRTDSYSLGCVCYKMFTGRAPFISSQGSVHELQDQHLYAVPPPLLRFVPGLPVEVNDLVLRMLAKEQELRPGMDEVLAVLSPLAPSPGEPEPRPRFVPDLTMPFRSPEIDCSAQSVPPRLQAASEWLDRRMVDRLCRQAQEEIDRGDPAEAVRNLAEVAHRVRKEWGYSSRLVRQVWELAADGLRIAGGCREAAHLYDGIATDLVRGHEPRDRADRAVAQLRAAECRLVDYDIGGAMAILAGTAELLEELPAALADQVAEARKDLQIDVNERCASPMDA
ncbi:hypothetical protein GCM10010218_04430 [Streptomyces mashuensis]|uniref:non-specific serine/threonine protein kinase n=1 Tax=Streptomyces mashuensis TaxID=33904 RepID=A0A919ATR8_9ACTN|nr:serine/threonine-protein kinase [Streptomyces mashuensis]GHF26647.1 hypothetical protein GCM10010218_04430 [Streptomyces mashuensis]